MLINVGDLDELVSHYQKENVVVLSYIDFSELEDTAFNSYDHSGKHLLDVHVADLFDGVPQDMVTSGFNENRIHLGIASKVLVSWSFHSVITNSDAIN